MVIIHCLLQISYNIPSFSKVVFLSNIPGDVRANEQLNLIAMHTIWMREHNRVARNLLFNNPAWLDDRLYEEARRIVIAEYQHIIFNEWLPLIVGTDLMQKFGLFPLTSGHSDLYLDTFDPRVSNEFATAAFRFGHSLIPSTFSKIAGTGARSGSSGSLNMKDIFFKPREFMVNKGKIFFFKSRLSSYIFSTLLFGCIKYHSKVSPNYKLQYCIIINSFSL